MVKVSYKVSVRKSSQVSSTIKLGFWIKLATPCFPLFGKYRGADEKGEDEMLGLNYVKSNQCTDLFSSHVSTFFKATS